MAGGKTGGPGDLPEVPKGGVSMSRDMRHPGGPKQASSSGREAFAYLHAGHIVHVDTETMVCSVRLDSMQSERHDVPLPAAAGSGPRSWAGLIPEKGTKVLIGWKKVDASARNFSPYIVEFLTSGTFAAREYEPFMSMPPEDAAAALDLHPELADDPRYNMGVVRLKARKGYPGDFIASSSGGSDFILDRDVLLTNRAGNELRLRDSDQTAVLQTLNEFTSNSAGYYRRGLVKRNAFNILPDLYPVEDAKVAIVSPGDPANGKDANGEPLDRSAAYDALLNFGLIKEDGSANFEEGVSPSGNSKLVDPIYPPITTSDGQRISYVVHGEHRFSFADTLYAYVEDRTELRHISDGIMAVTEEGDGFQVDPPFPAYVEDVKGTVVGNDFHSDAGRPLYRRVLGMKLFTSPNQKIPSDFPTLEAVDTVTKLGIMDAVGLARLFRINCPQQGSSNQFAFGITKEGKVMCHIPKTQYGEPDEKGKSLELNLQGLFKAIIGADENSGNLSLDMRTVGGINLDVGRFNGGPYAGSSVVLNLHGGVKRIHNGDPDTGVADDVTYNGSGSEIGTGSKLVSWGGNIINNAGGENAQSGQKITINAGAGGLINTVAGDLGNSVLGKTQEQYAQIVTTTYALGKVRTTVSGVDSLTMLAGAITRTLVAGVGIADTVTAGNLIQTVATGNNLINVGTGNLAATVGAGSLSLTCGAGPVSVVSALAAAITSGVLISLTTPITKIGATVQGFAVAGIPGPGGPHLDYLTGIPILGVPTVTIG